MWERKILYEGNSHGLFQYDAFKQFMKKRSWHLPLDNNSLYRMDIFTIEPNSTIIYAAKKRLVPRNLDLWHVQVVLAGYGIGEVERKLQEAGISQQKY